MLTRFYSILAIWIVFGITVFIAMMVRILARLLRLAITTGKGDALFNEFAELLSDDLLDDIPFSIKLWAFQNTVLLWPYAIATYEKELDSIIVLLERHWLREN